MEIVQRTLLVVRRFAERKPAATHLKTIKMTPFVTNFFLDVLQMVKAVQKYDSLAAIIILLKDALIT